MKNVIAKFLRNDFGATAIEYALLAALIAVFAIGATTALGNKISDMFVFFADKLSL